MNEQHGKDTNQSPKVKSQQGVDIQINESTERWSDFELADGTHLRLKLAVGAFTRLNNQFDNEGNPVYAVKGGPMCTIVKVPEELKKKAK